MTDIQIKFWQNYEAQRANRAAEEERYRSNTAQERQKVNELIESKRHNEAQEEINRLQAQIAGVHAHAAQRQAAVQERLAQLNAMRYGLEETLNNAQVAKTYAEQARIASETSLNRSRQYLVEQQTRESAAKTSYTAQQERESMARTTGQQTANYVAEKSSAGNIMSSYTKPVGDIFSSIFTVGKLVTLGG